MKVVETPEKSLPSLPKVRGTDPSLEGCTPSNSELENVRNPHILIVHMMNERELINGTNLTQEVGEEESISSLSRPITVLKGDTVKEVPGSVLREANT
jgi:hypothetical protein